MNKKTKILLLFIVIVVIIIVLSIIINFTKNKDSYQKDIEKISNDFYTEIYYPKTNKTILEAIDNKNNGVEVNLSELIKYTKTELTFDNCDKENSTITIYPKSPYKINDYEIKYNLKCEE